MVPEISLITSWSALPHGKGKQAGLAGMESALGHGQGLLDLYFLSEADRSWYRRVAGRTPDGHRPAGPTPQAFAASLRREHIQAIADRMQADLSNLFAGRLVGLRPRFAGFATFFPHASVPASEDPGGRLRQDAVRAVRNTLYLSALVGCRVVEVVGGAGVPGRRYRQAEKPVVYRQSRLEALADSVARVYDLTDAENPLGALPRTRLPFLAMELEPGPSFLLNRPEEFVRLREQVKKRCGEDAEAYRLLRWNADVSHAFLIGYTPDDVRGLGIANLVAHMHISDHAGDSLTGGAHASDLTPGTFHAYADQPPFPSYRDWLCFAVQQATCNAEFSASIAVEMEAVNDYAAVSSAISTTRRWLREAASELAKQGMVPTPACPRSNDFHTGALLVVDVGNSTNLLLQGVEEPTAGLRLERIISGLCRLVHDNAGSVLSFTGDGFIALFDEEHFRDSATAAARALEVAEKVPDELRGSLRGMRFRKGLPLTTRAALHWGRVYIPTSGQLREQIMGGAVVTASRMCDWLGHSIEPAVPSQNRGALIAASGAFHGTLPTRTGKWLKWGEADFKGMRIRQGMWLRWPVWAPIPSRQTRRRP